MPRSSAVCLCCDCLRELPGWFDDNEIAVCSHCGGELCDCPACLDTLRLLKLGVRDAATLGLYQDVVSWSPRDGVATSSGQWVA